MGTKFDEVMAAALLLTIEERGRLAAELLLSIEEPSKSEAEKLWFEEAERRLNEFREGKVRGIPAEEAFRRAMDDIS